jgi:outer membrane protein assembly factor BamB
MYCIQQGREQAMTSRCAIPEKISPLVLPALLTLACLSSCGRTVVVTTTVSSSCDVASTQSTPSPTVETSPGVVVQGPGHRESIITSGDVAYVGSDDGNVYAFSDKRGTPLWRQCHLFAQQAGVFAMSDGVVYVGDALQAAPLYALSTATGKVLWQINPPDALGFKVVVQDGVLYVESQATGNHYTLMALQGSDGHVLWQDAQSPALQLSELLGTGPDVVYIRQAMGQDPDFPSSSKLLALGASSGRVLWTATLVGTDGAATSAPVESNGVLYVETSRGGVYALRAGSGAPLWHIASPQGAIPGGLYTILKPIVANGLVYAGGYEGVAAYQATNGRVVWRYQTPLQGPFPSFPAQGSGVIYTSTGVGESGKLVALGASDGSIMWQRHEAATPNFGPMLVDNGLLVNNGNTGPVYALRVNDGSLAWQSPYMPEGGWYTSFGPPEALGTVAGGSGVVYIGTTDGLVHALRVEDGQQLWQYAVV